MARQLRGSGGNRGIGQAPLLSLHERHLDPGRPRRRRRAAAVGRAHGQTGVQRAFGPDLRRCSARALRNRFAAFARRARRDRGPAKQHRDRPDGTGFAAGGLVELVPALAVMLGANVGTTLIVQVLSFNVASSPRPRPDRRDDVSPYHAPERATLGGSRSGSA